MNQSETDLGIVNESQLLRSGISRRHAKGSFLLSCNRLVQPGPSGRFFTSAMRQAVAAIARFTDIGCHRLVK
jgi:hypothetical protein